jgi:hypothetical protein
VQYGEQKVRGAAAALAILLAGTAALAGCGGDDDSKDAGGTTSPAAPEDLRAPDAEVATGLQNLKQIAADTAAAVEADPATAESKHESIEAAWEPIEGTIKANDQSAYLTFEDNFATLGNAVDDGDSAKAAQASDAIGAAADAYLAAYPG